MKKYKTIEIILIILFILLLCFGAWNYFFQKPKEETTIKDQIFSIIAGFDFSDPESFTAVSEINDLGEESVPVLQELIKSESISNRWAAIILLPRFVENNPELKPTVVNSLQETVDDENDTLRMLTGAQLLSLGEKQGIPILMSCLSSTEATHFGEPPELVKERSLFYLQYYTKSERETEKGWQDWWEQRKEKLVWNEEKEIFEIK